MTKCTSVDPWDGEPCILDDPHSEQLHEDKWGREWGGEGDGAKFPTHDELLAINYGNDGPKFFQELVEKSKEEYPDFWGYDTDPESEA